MKEDRKDNHFHIFENMYEYGMNFEHASSDEWFCFERKTNNFDFISSQSNRLHKKVVEYEEDGYKCKQILILTIKINSGQS